MKTHWTMITLTVVVGTLISAAAWSQQPRNNQNAEFPSTTPLPLPVGGRPAMPEPSYAANPFQANPVVDNVATSSTTSNRSPGAPATAKVDEILGRLREADELHKPDLIKELETAIAAEFDEDMKQREAELTKLEERVAKLRAQLERRKKAKAEISQLQSKVLVNEIEGLGFSNPVSNPLESNSAGENRPWRMRQPSLGPQPDAAADPFNVPDTLDHR
jgi:hypothetical protein